MDEKAKNDSNRQRKRGNVTVRTHARERDKAREGDSVVSTLRVVFVVVFVVVVFVVVFVVVVLVRASSSID